MAANPTHHEEFSRDAFGEDAPNPFYTSETSDAEMMARWMLAQQDDEPEAN
jgi:hypothetical protein